MTGRLDGKVALVTGAGSVGPGWGNGRATAYVFAREGARVVLVDRDPTSLETTADRIRDEGGGVVVSVVADVTDPRSVDDAVVECFRTYGVLDVMVNNVGGSHPGGAGELALEDWNRQLDVNLTSAFLGCRAALRTMRGRGGSIINVSSVSGLRYSGALQVAYASAKAAIVQLSRVTAVQYAAEGVRVNTVVPGQLHTPMVEARLADQRAEGDVDKLLAERQARIPLGFMGDGRDTAYAALFLASDESRFVTGAEIVVDGGMSVRCD